MVCGVLNTTRTNASLRRRILICSRGKLQSSSVALMGTSASDSTSYQFMQRSKLPTMYFQRSLPRLPIPQLEKTCSRFLAAVEPILTTPEYAHTQQSVSEFQEGAGKQLNALLQESDANNKQTSYISEPWFDMYLRDRAPLPLNYNPLLVMKHDSRPAYQPQIVRATNLVISSLRFWRSLQSGFLEPEIYHMNPKKSDTDSFRQWMRMAPSPVATYAAYAFKAFPLDMSQYHRLFGVSRIPELEKDRLVQSSDSKHILVMRRGNMYAVDVLDADGDIQTPSIILARLQAVVRFDDERSAASVPIGVLTAGGRDDWARTRQHLVSGISEVNKSLLEQQVDSALFCVCLDSKNEPVYNEEQQVPLLKHLLAGEATNRWFDKSVSLLISADGTAAINFEHSWGDGVAVLRYFNEIYKETLDRPYFSADTVASVVSNDGDGVRPIDFQIDDKLRADVSQAINKNAAVIESLNMDMLRYPHLNKISCKRYRISPDSIMQLAFQLAYCQAFKGYVGTYESCSTAAFRHGRTETMRPCTLATKQFCEALLQPSAKRPSSGELRGMIDQCSSLHGQLTKEAAMGQGFDRHLFALKHMANIHNMAVPELFNTEAYRKINYNIISTSTLSSNALLAGSFGPVVRDGLGIGYSIQNEECGAIVTSYENQRDGKLFIESLEQAFNEICKVIETSRK